MLVKKEEALKALSVCLAEAAKQRDNLAKANRFSLGAVDYSPTVAKWDAALKQLEDADKAVRMEAHDIIEVAEKSVVFQALMAATL